MNEKNLDMLTFIGYTTTQRFKVSEEYVAEVRRVLSVIEPDDLLDAMFPVDDRHLLGMFHQFREHGIQSCECIVIK